MSSYLEIVPHPRRLRSLPRARRPEEHRPDALLGIARQGVQVAAVARVGGVGGHDQEITGDGGPRDVLAPRPRLTRAARKEQDEGKVGSSSSCRSSNGEQARPKDIAAGFDGGSARSFRVLSLSPSHLSLSLSLPDDDTRGRMDHSCVTLFARRKFGRETGPAGEKRGAYF